MSFDGLLITTHWLLYRYQIFFLTNQARYKTSGSIPENIASVFDEWYTVTTVRTFPIV